MMDKRLKIMISIKEDKDSNKSIEPQCQVKNRKLKHHKHMAGIPFWVTVMMKWELGVKEILNHHFLNLEEEL